MLRIVTMACLAVSCFGQIDAGAFAGFLHSKYGPPLRRETFRVQPDVEMVVDYAANGHVCRMQLPPIAHMSGNMSGPKAIDDLLDTLIPPAMRGKEINRMAMAMGAQSVSIVQYEYISISRARSLDRQTGVTVTFTGESCIQ